MTQQIAMRWMSTVLALAGLVVALAGCGGGSDPETEPATTESTITAPVTSTDDTSAVVGQRVDQTCADFVELTRLARDTDVAHGGNSVDDLEKLAAAASDLARNAPAEPSGTGSFLEGEPRESLTRIAEAWTGYLTVLSEKNVEPGPDAMLDPDIASGLDLSLETGVVFQWIDARCSDDVKAQLAELAG